MRLQSLLYGFVMLLFSMAAPAESADWLNYIEGKGSEMVYVDMDSIQSTSENTITVLKKIEPAGSSNTDAILNKIEMDCKNYRIRYLKVTTRLKNGKSSSVLKNEKFRKVTMEDDDESLMELICSLKKSK